jgi:hypothetical protein
MNKNYNNKDKVDLGDDLEIERIDKKYLKNSGYDFVPRIDHWTNIDEQKIKVKEIEQKTKQ